MVKVKEKMKYYQIIQLLREGMETASHPHVSIAFFRNDRVSTLIWLSLLECHYKKIDCNTESIFLDIPPHFASRPTVYKLIDNAVSKSPVHDK